MVIQYTLTPLVPLDRVLTVQFSSRGQVAFRQVATNPNPGPHFAGIIPSCPGPALVAYIMAASALHSINDTVSQAAGWLHHTAAGLAFGNGTAIQVAG